jgi:glycosyltransferase involved in cell wall biosynthesis
LFPFYFFGLKARVKSEIKRLGHFDALVIQNGCYPGHWKNLAALWAAHELKIPKRMLIIHHGALHNNMIRHLGESWVDYMVHFWATDIVAVSRATRQTLIDYRGFDPYKNPIRVIHNGIDRTPSFDDAPVFLREKFNVGADKILLGMVGRIERYKGHEDLLLALDEMDESAKKRFFILFVGEGKDEEVERLRTMAEQLGLEKNIAFTGYLPGDSKRLIAQLDLLLMLSKDFEGFGLTIAEAMFAKTPVIATTVGAIPEFVSNDIACLVPPESPADICMALLAYLADADRFIDRADKAEKHIQKFSGENMSRQYHRMLRLPA